MESELRVPVRAEEDVVVARQKGRAMAEAIGFAGADLAIIATAISEVARNIVLYAKHGEIVLGYVRHGGECGIVIVAQDRGPGIPDVAKAMEDGFSTSHGLGLGLPGARRLMDEFEIVSEVGRGTTITMRKWRRSRE